eukprot:3111420-Pleurochrysis_carterae.AAC.1
MFVWIPVCMWLYDTFILVQSRLRRPTPRRTHAHAYLHSATAQAVAGCTALPSSLSSQRRCCCLQSPAIAAIDCRTPPSLPHAQHHCVVASRAPSSTPPAQQL